MSGMLSEGQTLPRAELDALTDKRIRAITRLAYDHNPFLHGLFDSAGINPHSDVAGRSDLLRAFKRGVRTTGEDVRKCYADYATSLSTVEVWSSGSSGKPKRILMSEDSASRSLRVHERAMASFGVKDGEKMLIFVAPPPHYSGVMISSRAFAENPKLRTLAFRVPPMQTLTEEEKDRVAQSYIDMLYDFGPDHVRGGVFAVHDFAQFLTDRGLDKERLSVKSVIFGGDPASIETRNRIGSLWNAETFNYYVSSEAGLISYECRSHSGMHIDESNTFVASVDPETGDEVGVNVVGKDLCTCLYNEGERPATFFINYSHKDNLTMMEGSCPCGNVFKLSAPPTRDHRKEPIGGLAFDLKSRRSFGERAARRLRGSLAKKK